MHLGMIGRGKMGANRARRLLRDDHDVIGFALNADAVHDLQADGAGGATTLDALVSRLDPPRVLWMMVPAGDPVDQTLDTLLPLVEAGDILVDGGASGSVWGLKEGYSMMVGGPDDAVDVLRPALERSAPPAPWGRIPTVQLQGAVK